MDIIKNIIHDELAVFEEKFAVSMKSTTPLLDRIMKYIRVG